MLDLPRSKVAAVQTAPIFLDTAATIDKACALIAEAARNGARLVAFPEVFVPGYPYWNWLMTPIEGSAWFDRLCRAAITIPGPEVSRLCATARAHDCVVVIGVNERDPRALGTLYNTNVIIGADGALLGRHRKLVPTWAEKLTWAGGDGASLRVYDTPVGPLGKGARTTRRPRSASSASSNKGSRGRTPRGRRPAARRCAPPPRSARRPCRLWLRC